MDDQMYSVGDKRKGDYLADDAYRNGKSRVVNVHMSDEVSVFDEQLLKLYYSRLFPYNEMFQWLSYGNDEEKKKNGNDFVDKDFFYKREFSFTMEGDIYIRYLSFKSAEDLKRGMQSRQPHKIDIGAVYSAPAKDHLSLNPGAFKPVQRELVFDIDMTDYDEVRYCCDGANICLKCWKLMVIAVKVLNRALREDFNFKHILFVYSGRRGIHCWVSDKRARELTDQGRSAVAQYLNVEMANEKNADKIRLTEPLHPSLSRAYSELEIFFVEHILPEESKGGQGILSRKDRWDKVLNLVPDIDEMRSQISDEWSKTVASGKTRWNQLKNTIKKKLETESKKKSFSNTKGLATCIHDIVFTYTYPRLDINVSTHLNHLLKAPWAVHPKTGRVCVPIDVDTIDSFDPFQTPTLGRLNAEINAFDMTYPEEKNTVPDLEKTSLKSFVDYFNKDFLAPLYSSIKNEFREKAEKAAAETGDW